MGRGGQAIIRYCKNSYGIPTKKLPSQYEQSYFTDKEYEVNISLIKDVIDKFEPRARVIRVEVVDNSDTNGVDVTVEFFMQNINSPITVTTTLSRVR